MKPELRKDEILAAAVAVAVRDGLCGLRRDAVAVEAGVANGLVSRYFNTMNQLHRAVIRYAVHHEVLPIVAHALATGDTEARKAPDELKQRALNSLMA
jgi:AcrR family transcriptional regulator